MLTRLSFHHHPHLIYESLGPRLVTVLRILTNLIISIMLLLRIMYNAIIVNIAIGRGIWQQSIKARSYALEPANWCQILEHCMGGHFASGASLHRVISHSLRIGVGSVRFYCIMPRKAVFLDWWQQ